MQHGEKSGGKPEHAMGGERTEAPPGRLECTGVTEEAQIE